MEKLTGNFNKYLKGTATHGELRDLLTLLENESSAKIDIMLQSHWDAALHQITPVDPAEQQQSLDRLKQLLHLENPPMDGSMRLWRKAVPFIAAACLVLAVGLTALWEHFVNAPSFRIISLSAGEPPHQYVLPDRTIVWLNAATTLEYQEDFTENRNIRLQGQAYFEVAKDKIHPFTVVFSKDTLQVTGTKFVISDYPSDGSRSVHLREGSVKVHGANGMAAMQPDEFLTINSDGTYTKKALTFGPSADWIAGRMSFRNIPLGDVLKQLGRRYDVIFVNKGGIDPATPVTISFPIGGRLEEALESLTILTDIKYERKDTHRIEMSSP